MGSSAGPKLNAVLPTNNLLLSLDASNQSSYPRSGTTWTDISSNNYVGTLTNGPTFNSSNGGSISFDGSNDYVDISDFDLGNQFTFSAWIRTTSTSLGQIIARGNSADNRGLGFWINNTGAINKLGASGNNGSGWNGAAISNTVINDNQWHNVVGVYNQTTNTVTGYVDGILGLSANVTFDSNSYTPKNTKIGRNQVVAVQYYSGNIASVQIYNRALTAAEILDSYNGIKSKFVLYDSFADLTLLYVRGTGTIGDTTVPNLIRGGGNISLTAGTAINDTQNKWGGVSIKITNANLSLGPAITSIGTGDFTMELWIYVTAQNTDCRYFGGGGLNQGGFGSRIVGSRFIGMVVDGISWYAEVGFSPITNAWVHLAACRSGTTIRYFQNGSVIGSSTFTQSINMSAPYTSDVTSGGVGTWVSDLRITRAARYTAAFTVPTRQFDLPY